MAKKSPKSDRQAVIDEIRKKQKGAEKRRGFAIVGVCALIAVLIVARGGLPPGPQLVRPAQVRGRDPGLDRGARLGLRQDRDQAGRRQPAARADRHADQVHDAPPAFGAHWNEAGTAPAPFNRKFYTEKDRPELEALVHNLEHGYTILWYDQTAADDAATMNEIEALSDKFRSNSDNLRYKFIAAPWTSKDEKESGKFPNGKHIALSHWSAGGCRRDRHHQAGRRLPVLLGAQRRRAGEVHARATPTPTRPSQTPVRVA